MVKKFLFISFMILLGFILGIATLFIVAIPLEALMSKAGFTKLHINMVMDLAIIIWLVLTVNVTYHFYRRIILTNIKLAVITNILLLLLTILAFSQLIKSDNSIFTTYRATIVKGERDTYGPYPDYEQLERLNPAIPFEKVLLEREVATGKKIGLQIYSYPMLPWFSTNKDSLKKSVEFLHQIHKICMTSYLHTVHI